MKTSAYLKILVIIFLIVSCQMEDSSQTFLYEAEVIGKNFDCGIYAIKITTGESKVRSVIGTSLSDIYIAKNLP